MEIVSVEKMSFLKLEESYYKLMNCNENIDLPATMICIFSEPVSNE
jgi:hypothetical protein